MSKGVSSLSSFASGFQDVSILSLGDLGLGYEVSVLFWALCHMMGILSHLFRFSGVRSLFLVTVTVKSVISLTSALFLREI